MRTLRLIVLCILSLALPLAARASETPAEHAANVYAAQELAAAPLHTDVPDYSLSPADLAKSQHLSTIHVTLHFAESIWGILQLVLLLWLGGIAWMRDRAVSLSRNRWIQGFSFLLLFLIASTLLSLPLDIYSEHLSHVYGFSVQSWPSWTLDQLKSLGLTWLFGGLVVMLLFWIIRKLPNKWWIVFWLFIMPITVFGAFIGPYVSYLFYTHEPLQKSNPALVAQLEKVVAKGHMDIPPERMYLMKASDKTTTLNAMSKVSAPPNVLSCGTPPSPKPRPMKSPSSSATRAATTSSATSRAAWPKASSARCWVLYLGFVFIRWSLARFGAAWRIPSQYDWGTLALLLLALSIIGVFSEPVASRPFARKRTCRRRLRTGGYPRPRRRSASRRQRGLRRPWPKPLSPTPTPARSSSSGPTATPP